MIELRLWQHARALADHRRFAKASKALRLSQPALTRSIQELERRVGVPLFERRRGGVEPTDVGQTLLAEALRLLERAEGIDGEIARLRGIGGGGIVVGAGPYPADLLLGGAIGAFLERCPDVRVGVIVGDWMTIVRGIRGRELDLGVAEMSEIASEPDLRVQPLGTHRLRWVVRPGHPVLALRRPTLRDLFAHPTVTSARIPPRILPFLVSALPRRDRPLPTVACEPVAVQKDVVRASNAAACLPMASIAVDLRAGTLADVGLDEPWQQTAYGLISLAGRSLAPAAARLVREIRAVDRRLARTTNGGHRRGGPSLVVHGAMR
jgi:DNA-binding transcriptional LysR family regulator